MPKLWTYAAAIRLRSMGETVLMFIKNLHVENTVMYHTGIQRQKSFDKSNILILHTVYTAFRFSP